MSGQFGACWRNLSTWSLRWVTARSWDNSEKEGKICCGTLGNGRAISDAARTQNRGRSAPGTEPLLGLLPRRISPKLLQLSMVDTDRWARQLWKLSRFRLAFPGSCWSFGISQSNGALLVGVAENFQPGFDVSGNEAPVFLTRVPGCPHAPPTSPRMDDSQSSTLRHRFHT